MSDLRSDNISAALAKEFYEHMQTQQKLYAAWQTISELKERLILIEREARPFIEAIEAASDSVPDTCQISARGECAAENEIFGGLNLGQLRNLARLLKHECESG